MVLLEDDLEALKGLLQHCKTRIFGDVGQLGYAKSHVLHEHPSVVMSKHVASVEAAEAFEMQYFDQLAGSGGCSLLEGDLITV